MKTLIVIPDGAADLPQASLGGRTPLAAARTPHLDALAARGVVGLTDHVPDALPPGSEVACMSLLGYDPLACFTGRAPLEAAAQGIALGPDDWAVRCNLVTIATADDGDGGTTAVMEDFTAGHVSTDEARDLLAAAQAGLEAEFSGLAGWSFVPGVSYRNLLLYRGHAGAPAPLGADLRATPPHDLMDKSVADAFPRGTGSRLLADIMLASARWFADHPVNLRRVTAGKRPATHVWLWGVGRTPAMPPFREAYGVSGAMITAVDLLRGLAALAGWRRIDVPGATGYLDTDYAAKGRAAIAAFDHDDLVCVHVEAPDEASHQGDAAAKVTALEEIDRHVIGPVAAALAARGPHRILVCPDHPTFLSTKTHSRGRVPFLIAGEGIVPGSATAFDESAAAAGPVIEPGHRLMGRLLDPRPFTAAG
ncbi:MAG: cofactor-independent phosphoglycerate mutase [Planctomycetes bacterium]|nr:cofactor-independent phosphoglycerate mutase [Planctomycetota bacterium]